MGWGAGTSWTLTLSPQPHRGSVAVRIRVPHKLTKQANTLGTMTRNAAYICLPLLRMLLIFCDATAAQPNAASAIVMDGEMNLYAPLFRSAAFALNSSARQQTINLGPVKACATQLCWRAFTVCCLQEGQAWKRRLLQSRPSPQAAQHSQVGGESSARGQLVGALPTSHKKLCQGCLPSWGGSDAESAVTTCFPVSSPLHNGCFLRVPAILSCRAWHCRRCCWHSCPS